jgi:hypothetical protein
MKRINYLIQKLAGIAPKAAPLNKQGETQNMKLNHQSGEQPHCGQPAPRGQGDCDQLSHARRRAPFTALLALAITPGSALADPSYLSINGLNGANIKTCTPDLGVYAIAQTTYYGTYTYVWTLYRNGSIVTSASQEITCDYDPYAPCQPASFSYNAPALSGTYKVNLNVLLATSEDSNTINVTVSSAPMAVAKINGSAADNVQVCAVGPIVMDASSSCGSSDFLSVQLSDTSWNRYGPEAMRWLTTSDFAKYGPINNFDVKKFAEDQWFKFVPGQYYAIKLAVGPGWTQHLQLAAIQPSASALNINGSPGPTLDILGPNYAIKMDGTSSKCAASYFLSVQLSDIWWNRYGPEAMEWLTSSDFAKYGPLNNFDVKKFAEDQWFKFVPGQYYRAKLAIGPEWHETTTLIYIKP